MKILYISKSIIPSRTANSIHVIKMCQAFADNGHEVILISPNIKNKYEKGIENIYEFYGVRENFYIKKFIHPNFIGGAFLYTLAIFFYLLINNKFDLIYGRFLHGVYIGALLNNKVIYESHAPIIEKNTHRIIILKKLIKNKYLKKIVVISKELKKIYLQQGFIDESKLQVAHDGADIVEDLSKKINLLGSKNKLKVGYIGHLYRGKGIEVIDSMADKLDDDVEIHIVGGFEKDLNYWKKKITSKKIFFYGFIPHKKVSFYINAMDICLLPNQEIVHAYGSEPQKNNLNISAFTSPLKLFEYMAHRKSIIASDLPVIREILNDSNSILVKCDDITSWVSSIQKFKNAKIRESISSQALSDFSRYTWKNRASLVI
ncbi:glycosyltransferase [Candidatus Pelagibacter sp.]|nr:glycosyltransferase [Candidatus Pelagibacter sp.]